MAHGVVAGMTSCEIRGPIKLSFQWPFVLQFAEPQIVQYALRFHHLIVAFLVSDALDYHILVLLTTAILLTSLPHVVLVVVMVWLYVSCVFCIIF